MNELEDLLNLAKLEGQNANKVLILGEVPFDMAELLSEQSGISIESYKFSIDVYAIKHILKNHGIPEIEIDRKSVV